MQADYESAKADILNAQAALKNAQIALGANRGDIKLLQLKCNRHRKIISVIKIFLTDQAITKKQLDDSKFNLEQAKQQA